MRDNEPRSQRLESTAQTEGSEALTVRGGWLRWSVSYSLGLHARALHLF